MARKKRASFRQIRNVSFKDVDSARRSIPYLRRTEQQNIREGELPARKTTLGVSAITFSQELSLVDNAQLTSRINITVTDATKIIPLNFLTDIRTISNLAGFLVNSQDHDDRLTTNQKKHEYWSAMGAFVNIKVKLNSLDIVTQFTNRSGSTQDYFFEYRLIFVKD